MKKSFLLATQRIGLGPVVFFISFLLSSLGFAQTWNQGISLNASGVYGTSETHAVAVDADGNQYITGRFNGVIQFGTNTLYSTPLAFYSRSSDAFVARLNANGTWAWARALGNEAEGNGIAVAGTGSATRVYLVGTSQTGTLRDANDVALTGPGLTITTVGSTDAFVASLDGDGNWLWARTLASNYGAEAANAIAVTGTGSSAQLYLTGNASGGISLYDASHVPLTGQGQTTASANGNYANTFVASLDANGTWTWVRALGGGFGAQGRGLAVAGTGATAQVFLTGEYGGGSGNSSPAYLYDDTNTALAGVGQSAQSAGYTDAFVASISATGTWAWIRGIGSAGASSEVGYGIAATGAGSTAQAYVTGSCTGNTRLRDAANTAITSPGQVVPGNATAFVAQLGADGTWGWARAIGGNTPTTQARSISAVGTGSTAQLYLSGILFGPTNNPYDAAGAIIAGQNLASTTGFDTFIANLDASGVWNWARAVGSRSSSGSTSAIAVAVVSGTTQVYAVGSAESTATLRDAAGTPALYLPLSRQTAFVTQLTGAGIWQQARSSSDGGTSKCTATTRDADGNQYITGNFFGAVTFGNSTIYSAGGFYPFVGTDNAFVAKRNADGTWAWARALGGIASAYGKGIAVVGSGNSAQIYIIGNSSGYGEPTTLRDANDIPLTGPGLSLPGVGGGSDAFVAKLDASGNWLWARSISNNSSASSSGIAVTGAGSNTQVYITGNYVGPYLTTLRDENNNPVTGPGLNLLSSGGAFVARLDGNGTWQWARSMDGGGRVQGNGIATSGAGATTRVYITGSFSYATSLLDANNTALTGTGQSLTVAGGSDAFVASLDANGTWDWARALGGNATTWGDFSNAIAVAGTGNAAQIYITGGFSGTASPRDANNNALTGPGQTLTVQNIYTSAFVAKLDAAGTWDWARAFASDVYNYQVTGYGIAAAGTGSNTQVYVTGSFGISARPYNASNVPIQRANHHVTAAAGFGSEDAFVANLTVDGTWKWARALGGGINPDDGTGIAVSGTGRLATIDVAGYFAHEATLRDSTNQATPGTDLVGVRSNGVNTGFIVSLTFLQNTPLPVELTRFIVSGRGEDGLVEWSTASEKNSAAFLVESSLDGQTFLPVGQVAGHGTTTLPQHYQLVDANVGRYGRSIIYYRLRQTDEDGATIYSLVRMLQVAPKSGLLAQVYPNPSRQPLTLALQASQAGAVLLTITDIAGRQLSQQQAAVVPGTNALRLTTVADLPPGVYSLRVQQGYNAEVIKLVRE